MKRRLISRPSAHRGVSDMPRWHACGAATAPIKPASAIRRRGQERRGPGGERPTATCSIREGGRRGTTAMRFSATGASPCPPHVGLANRKTGCTYSDGGCLPRGRARSRWGLDIVTIRNFPASLPRIVRNESGSWGCVGARHGICKRSLQNEIAEDEREYDDLEPGRRCLYYAPTVLCFMRRRAAASRPVKSP